MAFKFGAKNFTMNFNVIRVRLGQVRLCYVMLCYVNFYVISTTNEHLICDQHLK